MCRRRQLIRNRKLVLVNDPPYASCSGKAGRFRATWKALANWTLLLPHLTRDRGRHVRGCARSHLARLSASQLRGHVRHCGSLRSTSEVRTGMRFEAPVNVQRGWEPRRLLEPRFDSLASGPEVCLVPAMARNLTTGTKKNKSPIQTPMNYYGQSVPWPQRDGVGTTAVQASLCLEGASPRRRDMQRISRSACFDGDPSSGSMHVQNTITDLSRGAQHREWLPDVAQACERSSNRQ